MNELIEKIVEVIPQLDPSVLSIIVLAALLAYAIYLLSKASKR